MCGILGYVGQQKALPIILKGLERLEYRGYDSAGIACYDERHRRITVCKEQGKLSVLKSVLAKKTIHATLGMGHTRWATHGEPSQRNAHPHCDSNNQIALVHNGIIENYAELKTELLSKGFRFKSETDTEIAVHLIAFYCRRYDFFTALQKAIGRLRGFFSFVIMNKETPDRLYVFKRSNPLVIGLGKGENFVASDVPAFLDHTSKVLYLQDNEFGIISREKAQIFSTTGKLISRKPSDIEWNISQAQKGGYSHFMLKEIFEQTAVLKEGVGRMLTSTGGIRFETLSSRIEKRMAAVKKIFMVSCGTAYHAGFCGSLMMDEFARVPSHSQVSSEFRYQKPILTKKDMVVLITQSGETADTLAALREAKAKGALTLAVVNVLGSTIAREADAVVYTHAGPEIGVASTKAYTAQLLTLAMLSLWLGRRRKVLAGHDYGAMISAIRRLPQYCAEVLKQDYAIKRCAVKHQKRRQFLYLGRGYNFPTALEGALKLKEISYAHAHGYAAGEMKHGPIALIDSEQPVLCLVPQSKTYSKMISNVEEIRARKGIVISIGTKGDCSLEKLSENFFWIPKVPEMLSPILTVLPLQLFAYFIAVLNGRDVDQPRNLAKSVTVE